MIDHGFGVKLTKLYGDDEKQKTFRWRNNPLIYKWCRQFEPLDWTSHNKWFDGLPDRQDVKMYGIRHDVNFVGVCGLTDIDRINSRAEFSLYIGTEYWGNGHGTNALKTLLAHGFDSLNLHSIWGETYAENPASKVFESIGMKLDGTRRGFYYRDGKYIDAHLYSILKGEFSKKTGGGEL